jgi:small subunit ribosomal protein S1
MTDMTLEKRAERPDDRNDPDDARDDTPNETPPETQDEAPDETPDETPPATPDGTLDGTRNETPSETHDAARDATPEAPRQEEQESHRDPAPTPDTAARPEDPADTDTAARSEDPAVADTAARPEDPADADTAARPEDPADADTAPGPDARAPEAIAADAVASGVPAAEEDEESGSDEFARLLDGEGSGEPRELKPGDKVTGTLVQIGEQECFVECGGRNELPLATEELRNDAGEMTHELGDTVTAHVQKGPDGLKLTMALELDKANLSMLQDAASSGTPVKGKVRGVNKGGLTVDIGGRRGFCPFSQIGLRRVDDPERFLEQELEFKILELSDDGRNIVLSRRALLQERREGEAQETRATLQLGDVREGQVTRLVPFGAFVDIGGVEGLVHISQIAHERVADPADVLREGQDVKVQVLEIQNLGQGRRERIGLSLKALAEDPWPVTARSLELGSEVTGEVTRLVDFGAFVQIQPGVEGLVHISEMADRRILHPREVCNEGDEITVKVLDVDLDRRRISLSMRQSSTYDG